MRAAPAAGLASIRSEDLRRGPARSPTRRIGPPRARRRPARSLRRHAPQDRNRRSPTPGRPTCGHGHAIRADAGTRRACCAPATPPRRRAARGTRQPGRPGRCRSGPARPRRPHATTTGAVWSPRVGARVRGSPRTRPPKARLTKSVGRRRLWSSGRDAINAVRETRYRRARNRHAAESTLVNSSWSPR